MEVYQSDNHFIIVDGNHFLWCSRLDGSLKAETGNFYPPVNAVCIGIVHGVVGKVKAHTDSEWKLILIKNQSLVGHILETHDIFQINKIAILSLSGLEPTELGLSPCPRHHGSNKEKQGSQISLPQASSKPLQKTWNSVKSAVENVKPKKSFLTDLYNIVQPERESGFQKEVKDKEKFERRIYEELLKLFNESNSFYYSLTFDLTNSIQRQYTNDKPADEPLWKRADERFFWNQYLLKELLESNDEAAKHWIVPIIQGFIQNELCLMEFDINKSLTPTGTVMFDSTRFQKDPLRYWLTIISRRSRHRAGTRSKKRGLEESGACANYVETEQILQFPPHLVSFVQVRGSVPVFWSQSGFKYRPPPRLEKGMSFFDLEHCKVC
ncbi:phosphatidylinositide phosphatase SAC2 isoform X1 [Octopus bimaculoides]|nr:phosphatidylinositide phosphatase SAC2 isoform X1 [Octopus bimaculoides]